MNKIFINDSSLRDGNHFVKHQISLEQIKRYCAFADDAGIDSVEVGHGLGIGASSLLMGLIPASDEQMLKTARENLKKSKLAVHIVPGMATIKKNIESAIDIGVDIFRVGSHCTEANVTRPHIEYLKNKNKDVYGILMMTALVDAKTLIQEAKKMQEYGANGIFIMDSTGTYTTIDTEERIKALKNNLSIKVGFHAHNNLGLAIANSITAVQNGADMIDACIRGFGAGAGNTQIEVLIPVLEKYNFSTNIDFKKLINGADEAIDYLVPTNPSISPINILTGLNKLFCGFEKPILEIAKTYNINYIDLIEELKNKKLIAVQEDLIIEAAQNLVNKK